MLRINYIFPSINIDTKNDKNVTKKFGSKIEDGNLMDVKFTKMRRQLYFKNFIILFLPNGFGRH